MSLHSDTVMLPTESEDALRPSPRRRSKRQLKQQSLQETPEKLISQKSYPTRSTSPSLKKVRHFLDSPRSTTTPLCLDQGKASSASSRGKLGLIDYTANMLRAGKEEQTKVDDERILPAANLVLQALKTSNANALRTAFTITEELAEDFNATDIWTTAEKLDACGIARSLVELTPDCLDVLIDVVGPLPLNSPTEVALAKTALAKNAEADRAAATLRVLSPDRQLHLAQKLLHRAAKRRDMRARYNGPSSAPPRNPYTPRALFGDAPTAAHS